MARPKSDIDRVQAGLRIRPEILRAMKHLSIDMGKPLNQLFEEAAEAYLRSKGATLPETISSDIYKKEPPK